MAAVERHLGRFALTPWRIDVAVALVVAGVMVLTISVAEEDGTRPPGAIAYVLGLVVAALLLARRRWPLLVLVGSIGTLLIYYALDYPAFSPAVPLAVAAYTAAAAGRGLAAAAILAALVVVSATWRTVGESGSLLSDVGTDTLADASLFAAVLLLGEAVRHRRAWAEEVRERLARARDEQDRTARERLQEERLRIARELHDVTAHTVAALSVHAAVAADALDDDRPDRAKAALRTIREQSRDAISELRATVGVLRGGAGDPAAETNAPAPRLADVDELVRTAAAAGIRVEVRTDGRERELPAAVELTAYRIVQESLTNVVRHADAEAAVVLVGYGTDALVVEVGDDGRGAASNGGAGHGVLGMRERVAALGGTLEAGPADGGGFRVRARLPLPGRAG